MTLITKIAAAVTAVVIGNAAAAQDFTNMDLTALNNQWNMNQNDMMNAQLGQIIWQNMNDPRVIALYNQQMATGQFYGSLADFAYKFAYTGGMSEGGYANAIGTAHDLDGRFRSDMNGYWNNQPVYRNAYDGYNNGWANNMDQYGNLLLAQ